MLSSITIQNFITVKQLYLEFQQGLHIITGETGAGKSIWIDALGLALGNRAAANQVRHGENQCDITLCIDTTDNTLLQAWLKQQAFTQEESQCMIRRTVYKDGRSRATINATPCTLAQLKTLSQFIIQIHGQHQQQTLLKTEHQRQQFDHYAQHQTLLEKINKTYKQWQLIQKELALLHNDSSGQQSELDLLRYQLDELDTLNLETNEWQMLSDEHQQLHNAHELMSQLNKAYQLITDHDNTSATQLISEAHTEISAISHQTEHVCTIKELLNTANIHLEEASNEIQQFRDQLNLSPEHLDQIEKRLSLIHDIARKHHSEPKHLFEIHHTLKTKLNQLEHRDDNIAALEKTQHDLLQQYKKLADRLTASRKKLAKQFNQAITDHMRELGIQAGEFKLQLTTIEEQISPYGQENLWFSVKTNPQQPFQAMQKIVSGGELSRISLAVQLITAQRYQTPSLIFDEVDVGIGGKTAATVGTLLRELSQHTQVLCITHLPQVAAYAHHHYKVEKHMLKDDAITEVSLLNKSSQVQEIARMLGGREITKQTLAHAEELISL